MKASIVFLICVLLQVILTGAEVYAQVQTLEVPLDWSRRNSRTSEKLELAYKILNPEDTELPFLFVIGGGPAAPTIKENYETGLAAYTKKFRVVLFDQRGTGLSSPLTPFSVIFNPERVIQNFTGTSIARDLGALIRHLNPDNSPFHLMGISYGGVVAQIYLQEKAGPPPKSLILNHPIPVAVPPVEFMRQRFNTQIQANIEAFAWEPKIKRQISQVRHRIRTAQLPGKANAEAVLDQAVFWAFGAKDERPYLKKWLDYLVSPKISNETAARALVDGWAPGALSAVKNYLGEIVTSTDTLQGQNLNRVTYEAAKDLRPIQSWMLTEARAYGIPPADEDDAMLSREISALLPRYAWKADPKKIRKALKSINLIYVSGSLDVQTPEATAQDDFKAINPGTGHWISSRSGDHFSTLSEATAELILGLIDSGVPRCEALFVHRGDQTKRTSDSRSNE